MRNTLTIAPNQEDTKTLATELSEELFPKITNPEDINVGDEVVPATYGTNTNRNGKRWLIIQIEVGQLVVQERFLFETHVFHVDFNDVRLNPYNLH